MSDIFCACIIGHKTAKLFAEKLNSMGVPLLARDIRPHKVYDGGWTTYHVFTISSEYESASDAAYLSLHNA